MYLQRAVRELVLKAPPSYRIPTNLVRQKRSYHVVKPPFGFEKSEKKKGEREI